MADAPKISDQYHRSRFACFTLSTLAFVASLMSEQDFTALEVFKIRVGSIDHSFVILALITSSFVSLLSVYALYRDDVSRYVQYFADVSEPQIFASVMKGAQHSLDQLNQGLAGFISLLNSAAVNDAISQGRRTFTADEAEKLIDQLLPRGVTDRIVDLARIASTKGSGWIDQGERSSYEHDFEDALYTLGQTFEGARQAVSQNMQRADVSYTWDGENIEKFRSNVLEEYKNHIPAIPSLIGQLRRYNDAMKSAHKLRKLEYKWIGVGAPAVLFCGALLHCIGRLFWAPFYTAPAAIHALLQAIQ